MKQLGFATREEAEARSRAEWERRLGRAKEPEDVTEFWWPVAETDDGTVVLKVPADEEDHLSLKERSMLRDIATKESAER